MPQDFAKKKRTKATASRSSSRSAARKTPQVSTPGWAWLLTGVALGAFIMFLIYLSDRPASTPSDSSQVVDSATDRSHPASSSEQDVNEKDTSEHKYPKPRFDFYQLLKESEVQVKAPAPQPEVASSSRANKKEQDRTSKEQARSQQKPEKIGRSDTHQEPSDTPIYLLQAGSFRSLNDADQLRAELLLLDLEARIETVTLKQGVWHRVLVGPFQVKTDVNRARAALVRKQINPLLLKKQSTGG